MIHLHALQGAKPSPGFCSLHLPFLQHRLKTPPSVFSLLVSVGKAKEACGAMDQLCVGLEAGIEGGIHATYAPSVGDFNLAATVVIVGWNFTPMFCCRPQPGFCAKIMFAARANFPHKFGISRGIFNMWNNADDWKDRATIPDSVQVTIAVRSSTNPVDVFCHVNSNSP
jgi:hypothetical protein